MTAVAPVERYNHGMLNAIRFASVVLQKATPHAIVPAATRD
jgi:hypothetical protein